MRDWMYGMRCSHGTRFPSTCGRFSEKAGVRVSRKMGAVTLTTEVVLYVTGKLRVPADTVPRGSTLRVEKLNIHE